MPGKLFRCYIVIEQHDVKIAALLFTKPHSLKLCGICFIVLLTLPITQHEYSTHVDPIYICQHHMRHVNVVLAVVVDALKAKLFCEDILRNE